jgi:hypothetical protein
VAAPLEAVHVALESHVRHVDERVGGIGARDLEAIVVQPAAAAAAISLSRRGRRTARAADDQGHVVIVVVIVVIIFGAAQIDQGHHGAWSKN